MAHATGARRTTFEPTVAFIAAMLASFVEKVEAEYAAIMDRLDQKTVQAAHFWEDAFGWERTDPGEFRQMRAIQTIGGAVIAIAIVTVVVNEVLTTSAVNNSSGPFTGVINSLETTGVAAMTLLVIGLLVAAASRLMGFFGGGF